MADHRILYVKCDVPVLTFNLSWCWKQRFHRGVQFKGESSTAVWGCVSSYYVVALCGSK